MDTKAYPERRRFPRANFLCKVILRSSQKEFLTHTQNISIGGVRILLFEDLKVKNEVELIIFASRRLEVSGRIIWSLEIDKKEDESLFDIGIEFLNLEEPDRKFLEELVEELLRKEKNGKSA